MAYINTACLLLSLVGFCIAVMDEQFKADLRESQWNMYQKMNIIQGDKTYVFCPLSIQFVMGMLAVGTKGETQQQLENALQYSQSKSYDFVTQFGEATQTFFPGNQNANLQTTLANRLYLNSKFTVRKEYQNLVENNFNGDTKKLPFRRSEYSAGKINDWVEQKTNDLIKDFISPDLIDRNTQMIIVNALYFSALWRNECHEGEMTFFDVETWQYNMVPSIQTNQTFYYIDESENKGMRYFAIPFQHDTNEAYYFMACPTRPYPSALSDFDNSEKLAKEDMFGKYMAQLDTNPDEKWNKTTNMTIIMPSFKTQSDFSVTDLLSKMGVTKIFTNGDFGGITNDPIVVSNFIHAATFGVNETHVEAAAATAAAAGVRTLEIPEIPEPDFSIDQPFYFGIFEKGMFIFMGQYHG